MNVLKTIGAVFCSLWGVLMIYFAVNILQDRSPVMHMRDKVPFVGAECFLALVCFLLAADYLLKP